MGVCITSHVKLITNRPVSVNMYLVPKYKVLVMFHLLKKVHFNDTILKYMKIGLKIIEAIVEKNFCEKKILLICPMLRNINDIACTIN